MRCAPLDSAGYRYVDQVMEHGGTPPRLLGHLFPMGSEQPYRLDFLMMR